MPPESPLEIFEPPFEPPLNLCFNIVINPLSNDLSTLLLNLLLILLLPRKESGSIEIKDVTFFYFVGVETHMEELRIVWELRFEQLNTAVQRKHRHHSILNLVVLRS